MFRRCLNYRNTFLMQKHLESKTIVGLLLILATAILMGCLGKLTPEMVEILKWIGGSFMMVRTVANFNENLEKRKLDQ